MLDVGCGSGHAARHLRGRYARYVGLDWSAEQIDRNRTRYPDAEFVAGSLYDSAACESLGRFDVVMTLYVVEHLVWPHRLLHQIHRLTRPGGLIAVLTPPFRHKSYLKSFDYGLSALPIKTKLARLKLLDATLHVYHHRFAYPRLLRRCYPRDTTAGRFLIHLEPVCLRGGEFFADSDAVYLADTAEMIEYLVALGATPVVHWPDWGYLLMHKAPGSAENYGVSGAFVQSKRPVAPTGNGK